jgi:predicted dehydrogenase/threonine dehydrogenase-like Zn-dependent dehydrogenase
MKQVFKTKQQRIVVREAPPPRPGGGDLLVLNQWSLISAGTETGGMVLDGDLRGKLRVQGGLVRKGLAALRTTALRDLWRKAAGAGGPAGAIGYSSAGLVLEAGLDAVGFRPGDLVACAGSGIAAHAEVVAVPRLLAAKIPDGLSTRDAAWATVASIALQGVRQAEPRLGETVLVSGLGLIGLLSVQLLRANGCRVIGIDPLPDRRTLALACGAEVALAPDDGDLAARVNALTEGLGVDAALLTAGTASSAPLNQAMELLRRRGRAVIVGAVGLELERGPFYMKEIELRIACSYGPGRYDPDYEQRGRDYPPAWVRWTENRNLQAVLRLLAEGTLRVEPLLSAVYPVEDAPAAFAALKERPAEHVGVMLRYAADPGVARPAPAPMTAKAGGGRLGIGVVGAGGFCARTHLPALAAQPAVELHSLATRGSFNGAKLAAEFGVAHVTTDPSQVIGHPDVAAVLIATRHESHAELALAAIAAGRHVFVEKPAAIHAAELERLEQALEGFDGVFTVGYNRRYAPLARRLRAMLAERPESPPFVIYRVNAGALPEDHWTQHRSEGGGRLIGEGCHFIDLCSFLAGELPEEGQIRALPPRPGGRVQDQWALTLSYPGGALAQVQYISAGSPALAKERIEVHAGGSSWVLDDFRELEHLPAKGASRSWREADKGHRAEIEAFVRACRGEPSELMSVAEALSATAWAIELQDALDGATRLSNNNPE